eukprot:m.32130 g.32130  ORF g.32130 m.32130 type:complete len:230 (-) comp12129_c0_seq2:1321-2010(-)
MAKMEKLSASVVAVRDRNKLLSINLLKESIISYSSLSSTVISSLCLNRKTGFQVLCAADQQGITLYNHDGQTNSIPMSKAARLALQDSTALLIAGPGLLQHTDHGAQEVAFTTGQSTNYRLKMLGVIVSNGVWNSHRGLATTPDRQHDSDSTTLVYLSSSSDGTTPPQKAAASSAVHIAVLEQGKSYDYASDVRIPPSLVYQATALRFPDAEASWESYIVISNEEVDCE